MSAAMMLGVAAFSAPRWNEVTFSSPTVEPSLNIDNISIIGGGMPIGNGETTALVFPVVKAFKTSKDFGLRAGVHIMLSMMTAMSSDTSPMPLGIVSIETEPPLFEGRDYRQSLYLDNATVEISTSTGSVVVWADATTNRVVAHATRRNGVFSHVRASVHSLRPSQRFNYSGRCSSPTAAPDVWSRPTGDGSVGLSHRNEDEDIAFLNQPAAFNATLRQQGLDSLIESLQSLDVWRHRTSGLVLSSPQLVREPDRHDALHTRPAQREAAVHVLVSTLAKQTASQAEWEAEAAAFHSAHRRLDASRARRAHAASWEAFWARSHIWTRYVQAIQTGTWVPIKFNGMAFTAQLPPEQRTQFGPMRRFWGSCNWWQNTRLAYWTMLAAADSRALATLFEYYLRMTPLLSRRTELFFNHTGLYVTETKTLFGAYDPCDYGAPDYNRSGLNPGYQASPFIRFDFGGNAGLPELCMMLLDHYLYTLDDVVLSKYMPLLSGTLDFFAKHYNLYIADHPPAGGADQTSAEPSAEARREATGDGEPPYAPWRAVDTCACTNLTTCCRLWRGKADPGYDCAAGPHCNADVCRCDAPQLRLFPTQALETYQCPRWPASLSDCPLNDHPTVAALHALTERALDLPSHVATREQREQWRALRRALPPLPMVDEENATVVAPYEGYPQDNITISNSETPELYSTHPYRLLTLASSLRTANRRDIRPALHCLESSSRRTCRNADGNVGWDQGLLNAALLGRAARAAEDVLARAQTEPAVGFRFPAFMPHLQDYQPSEDHLANMNSALQLMLLAPADDGLAHGGLLLFPAWPCAWDVDFRLAAPRQTVVSGKLVNGSLVSLKVEPVERRSALTVLPCQ